MSDERIYEIVYYNQICIWDTINMMHSKNIRIPFGE